MNMRMNGLIVAMLMISVPMHASDNTKTCTGIVKKAVFALVSLTAAVHNPAAAHYVTHLITAPSGSYQPATSLTAELMFSCQDFCSKQRPAQKAQVNQTTVITDCAFAKWGRDNEPVYKCAQHHSYKCGCIKR